jgi:hypothetical protein
MAFPLAHPRPLLTASTLRSILGLGLAALLPLRAAEPSGDEVVKMEPFNVTAYGGKIPIIDGFTGKDYKGNNDVVFNFAASFNKLLLGYHKKLVGDEIKHMQFRLQLGKDFEREMGQLSAAFGFGRFTLDHSTWLRRERAIITRLIREPFFKIKALIVWDLDRLQSMAPHRPDSKYAADIRYNAQTQHWERRITARWDVFFTQDARNLGSSFATDKTQGLNLDTLRGFHYIERGLPLQVPSTAFQEVKLTYPIFYSDRQAGEKELTHLQQTLVANLHFIYDPFSWVARRDTRFRGGFGPECLEHIQAQRLYVEDRDWFDPVFARFLSDIITLKLQGAGEIYALHMLSKRLSESPRALGLGLDLLNWNKGENREASDKPEAEARIHLKSPGGFRFVLIDAYQRFGDQLTEKIKNELRARKESRQKMNGQALLSQIIAELAGLPFDEFAQRAKEIQEAQLARHRITRPSAPPPPPSPRPEQN